VLCVVLKPRACGAFIGLPTKEARVARSRPAPRVAGAPLLCATAPVLRRGGPPILSPLRHRKGDHSTSRVVRRPGPGRQAPKISPKPWS
jgi:hypothetical protein